MMKSMRIIEDAKSDTIGRQFFGNFSRGAKLQGYVLGHKSFIYRFVGGQGFS